MNIDTPVEKIEESILSVGDRVTVDNSVWKSTHGKVVRLHHTGEVVVRHADGGNEHHHSPQDIKKRR
jgi:transcription antitermination factor NusG|tara:strand:- start:4944 stop:5144 length:201 start_codon:yes stop_codon:yes gene_type:complete